MYDTFSLYRSTQTLCQNRPVIHYIHKQEPSGILTRCLVYSMQGEHQYTLLQYK